MSGKPHAPGQPIPLRYLDFLRIPINFQPRPRASEVLFPNIRYRTTPPPGPFSLTLKVFELERRDQLMFISGTHHALRMRVWVVPKTRFHIKWAAPKP